jgi:hypothetical protein
MLCHPARASDRAALAFPRCDAYVLNLRVRGLSLFLTSSSCFDSLLARLNHSSKHRHIK